MEYPLYLIDFFFYSDTSYTVWNITSTSWTRYSSKLAAMSDTSRLWAIFFSIFFLVHFGYKCFLDFFVI